MDQTRQGQLKVTETKAEAQLGWRTTDLGTAPPPRISVSVGIRPRGQEDGRGLTSKEGPHHTPSGPAQAACTGPTSSQGGGHGGELAPGGPH